MVSADNLNLDVLELVFCFLSGNDLPSVALVSKSFLAGVIPRLYSTISYQIRQAKGYSIKETMSPFASLLAHPHIGVHVRNIEIRSVPMLKSRLHPTFVRECREALQLCRNLRIFKCTVPGVLPMFLPSLGNKERLESIRIHASLTSDQAKMLAKLGNLHHLALEFATWNVVDMLPSWTQSMSKTLSDLTLYMITELHEGVLESMLVHLPNLLGLHVLGCPKVDHIVMLRQVSHTPLLQSLSLTTSESTCPLTQPPPSLRHLRYLAFDTRYTLQPSPSPTILASVLSHLKSSSPALLSFAIKLPERKIIIGEAFVTQLIELFGFSLRRLAFLDCGVAHQSIAEICKSCPHLERLDLAIPVNQIQVFMTGVEHSRSLNMIVDVDNHVDHGIRKTLGPETVMLMFVRCRSLKKIVSHQRIWTGRTKNDGSFALDLERRFSHNYGSLWFTPRRD
ncbi:hypothetical protein HYPSUDRAFT_39391 [Hypholoma sublateritium FD-334 SS-4]|uniref:F-box domain-containing protein n=1 Tax=Hypholoma sublateritium (strain FD-334 SS-4) TaxID=945553 RepID=A0A0D2NYQ1_HYPSF|nr:hypothetical protein HYPSUDRAFT_39391 [Hypholoma sublateritium FD-334 SS-4]